jgi:hypothetical protein
VILSGGTIPLTLPGLSFYEGVQFHLHFLAFDFIKRYNSTNTFRPVILSRGTIPLTLPGLKFDLDLI